MSQHELVVHPLVVRTLEVLSTHQVTPRMRRIRLGGPELAGLRRDGLDLAAFAAPGFDDHVKLIFAPDGDLAAAVPRQLADGIEWTDVPGRECRDYTPRAVDVDAGWIDLDFVLHGDGPAASWAGSAAPGDRLAMVGPKSSMVLPEYTTGVLLVGDETALPAIGRFLDERPLPVPAHAVVILEDLSGRQELAVGSADSILFVQQDPTDGEALLRAVRDRLEVLGGLGVLGERPFVWAAGESKALLPMRRWAAREHGMPRSQMGITGYWHAEPDPTDRDAAEKERKLPPSPVDWFAVRAALELGLLDELREGQATAAQLASRSGTRGEPLTVLLDVLAEQGLLTAAPSAEDAPARAWKLTDAGRDLVDDEHVRENYEGRDAARLLSLAELPQALRSRTSAWRLRHGRSFVSSMSHSAGWDEETVEEAGSLRFLQHGLLRALRELPALVSPGSTVAVVGPGAQVVADMLASNADGGQGLSLLLPGTVRDCPSPVDAIVSALHVHMLENDETVDHLRDLRELAPEAVVIAEVRPDALGGRTAARSLLTLAETGAAPRDEAALVQLARQAGWGGARMRDLGWGVGAAHLLPEDGERHRASEAAGAAGVA